MPQRRATTRHLLLICRSVSRFAAAWIGDDILASQMSSNLSIPEVLADLEAQIVRLEQQETFHREQQAACAAELEKVRERYESFKAAAAAVGEVVRPKDPRIPALEDDGRKTTVSKLIARVIEAKPEDERFGPTSLARELSQRFPKTLRRPVDGRAVSVTLRRLCRDGRIQLVQEGRAFHEAVYVRAAPRASRRQVQ
jgi:hypothetical protein